MARVHFLRVQFEGAGVSAGDTCHVQRKAAHVSFFMSFVGGAGGVQHVCRCMAKGTHTL